MQGAVAEFALESEKRLMNSTRQAVVSALIAVLGISYASAQAPAAAPKTNPGAQTATAVGKTKVPAKHARKKKKEEPPPPPPPLPPPKTPADLSPVAPQVSYQNGQLTIVAQNCTLADVMKMVSARTGARLDMPASAASVRVVTKLGPGAPQNVLAELLDGTHYDYVVLGSATRPGGIDQIVLTSAQAGATTTAAQGTPPPRMQAQPQPPPGDEEMNAGDEGDQDDAASPEPEAVPSQEPQPEQQMPPDQQAQPDQPEGQDNPQQPKTPEQLLQELQRMQQQQQQQPQEPPH